MGAVTIRFAMWHLGNLLKSQERMRDLTIVSAVQLVMTVVITGTAVAVGGVNEVAAGILPSKCY